MNPVPVFANNANNSLFVGDLSKFCTEANLENLFAQFGQILDVKIKRNNTTGKTLSYGFVYFANDDCAARAMEKLNNVPFFGRNLRIRWAIHNAKAQKAPEESVINSVYVRFITPKVNEYITEEAFHKVFDHFGCVVDVSIKESSVDQRTNRQSGYGFVHFSADNAGISAAFQAVSAVDNATIDGVTYNVELSKNLLKQFNEMNRANGNGVGATGSTSSHASGTSSPMPVYNNMSMVNGNAYGQSPHHMSPHGQSPHGAPAPWPTQANNALYGQNNNNMNNRMSPSTAARPGFNNSPGGYNQQYPMQQQQQQQMYQQQGQHLSPMQMQQQQMQMQMQQRYSPQAYSPPPGQIMGMNNNMNNNMNLNNNLNMNMNMYQQQPDLGLGNYQRRTNAQPITSLLNDTNLQNMYRPDSFTNDSYGKPYGTNESTQQQPSNQSSHQQQYNRYPGSESQSFENSAGTGLYNIQPPAPPSGFDPFQDADQYFGEQDCDRSHLSLASGGAHSSLASRSPHCLSPLPGKSRHGSEDFTVPQNGAAPATTGSAPQGSHHVRQGSNGSHMSHTSHHSHNTGLFSQHSLHSQNNGPDGGMLHNAEQAVHSATYSPLSNGAISPMYDSDGNHSRYGAKQPPPLNLNAVGGSSASSVRSVPSAPSGSTSPVPIGRAKPNGNTPISNGSFWENTDRGDKPPTPRGGRAVGSISRQNSLHGGVPLPGQLNLSLNSSLEPNGSNNAISPTNSAGVAAGHHFGQLSAGLAQGITPSLPPSGLLGRGGLQSRSSSTSSATTSTLGVFSGTVSPIPGQYGTSLAANAARKAAHLPELEMYGVNRSMSSGGSADRNMPALSTMGTTDSESGFFRSNSSLRVDSSSTGPSASNSLIGGGMMTGEHAHREQQALLASQIMLQGISLPSMLADESPQGYDFQGLDHQSLLGQNWQGQGQGQRENFHKDYFVDANATSVAVAAPTETAAVASRPTRLTSAMKQLSMQSVSTIGEDGVEDENPDDEEYTYSSASLSPKHSSSSLNLSSRDSFRIDTSFLLSPQSSTQSLECSPYNGADSARGRPPSGSVPSATTSIYPPNATAPNLLRRTFLLDVAAGTRDSASSGSQVEESGDGEGKDSRPVSLTSVASTDSRRVSLTSVASTDSYLAGIAIASGSSSSSVDPWDHREHGNPSPAQAPPVDTRRRSSRPEGVRLSRGGKTSIAEVAAESPDAQKGKKQLSLMQFFKPVVRATSAGEN